MMSYRLLRLFLTNLLVCTAMSAVAQGLRLPGAAAAAPGAAAVGAGQRPADHIVAIVNSEPITNQQVRVEMQRLAQQLSQSRQAMPPAGELATAALERLIIERAQLQLARDTGIRIDESAINEAELSVARQNQSDLAELQRRLAADGIDRNQFRNQLRDQLIRVRLREREVNQKTRVTELEIDQYLRDQQIGQDQPAALINIAHVLVSLPDEASQAQVDAALARLQPVLDRARAGEDFGKLAREVSQAPDASAGGQIGLRPVDRYPALFVDATRAIPVGGYTVVRSGAGMHLLKVLEKRSNNLPATTLVQTRASHILLRPSAQLSESASRDALTEYRKQLQAGQADFATLAKEKSQDGSAAQGGDLGWTSPGQFVPEFEEVMNGLAPGQISEPLVSRFGLHLIQVQERRTVQLTQREQREAVRAVLREKKLEEAYVKWIEDLRARAYIEMREPPG